MVAKNVMRDMANQDSMWWLNDNGNYMICNSCIGVCDGNRGQAAMLGEGHRRRLKWGNGELGNRGYKLLFTSNWL